MTSVWPALWPPWKRTTTSARLASQSTTLPLPSSPHWAPMTATLAMVLLLHGMQRARGIEDMRAAQPRRRVVRRELRDGCDSPRTQRARSGGIRAHGEEHALA